MLEPQLDRIHMLVGRIATEFSEIETLWFLVFTCLMHEPREVVNAIFDQLKTGAQQRQMILDVAEAALPPKSDLLKSIKTLCEQTKILAGRRNATVHSIIHIMKAAIPPHIAAAGSSKPSKIKSGQVEKEIVEIYCAMLRHGLDMHELRLQAILHSNPNANLAHERQQLERGRQEVQRTISSDPILLELVKPH